jgi:LysR family transcriptional regulator for metE and metH
MKRIGAAMPRLDTRDLEVILALASAGSTSKAARSLHRTQSAVSRALCVAEEKIGVRLFERGGHGLTPTAAGQRLVTKAGPLLAQFAELEGEIVGAGKQRHVRLVCECYTAYRWLPSALKELRRKLPNLDVTLAVEHTRDPAAALRDGAVDIALLTTASVGAARDVEEAPLFEDEVVFLVASSHPLATRRTLTASDLSSHPLVTSETPPGETQWFASAVFGRRRPQVTLVQFPLTEAVVDAARAGMGIAVLSEWMAQSYLVGDGLVAKRLASGPLRRPWRIAFRRGMAEAAARLISALQGSPPRVYPRLTA